MTEELVGAVDEMDDHDGKRSAVGYPPAAVIRGERDR
jgi:hypothetical protein